MPTKKKRIMICLDTTVYGENYLDLIKELTGKKQTIDIVNNALCYYYWKLMKEKTD